MVEEQMPHRPEGHGEHLWLKVRKRGFNTDQVAKLLARIAGVTRREVGYAGMKDRNAVTVQWFSLHLPGRPDLSGLAAARHRGAGGGAPHPQAQDRCARRQLLHAGVARVPGRHAGAGGAGRGDRRARGAQLLRRTALRPRRRQHRECARHAGRVRAGRRSPPARHLPVGGARVPVQRGAGGTHPGRPPGAGAFRRGLYAGRQQQLLRGRGDRRHAARAAGRARHSPQWAAVGRGRAAEPRRGARAGSGDRRPPFRSRRRSRGRGAAPGAARAAAHAARAGCRGARRDDMAPALLPAGRQLCDHGGAGAGRVSESGGWCRSNSDAGFEFRAVWQHQPGIGNSPDSLRDEPDTRDSPSPHPHPVLPPEGEGTLCSKPGRN
ncbi:MAG: tRNA pseudouridine(13) synthase TruD [Desulfomicrobium escambiense]|nr:tRNA pseudouridine(13) synthase TruD [Desulfomicrobium escambiense]